MGSGKKEWDWKMTRAIEPWFTRHGRDLPWRTTPRDAYRSLVSEVMLQQTQVARVLPRYDAFLRAFPTVAALAAADEHRVLAAWTGLGYYRRARLLHAAAKAVTGQFGGAVPDSAAALRLLPGVGAYTAGAIASIVHGQPAPIVDGNVARVLMRVEGKEGRHQDAAVLRWAWERSGKLVAAAGQPGVFNEGLMELGAVVCTPRSPRCGACPLARACAARAAGRQETIPAPKKRAERTRIHCATAVVRDGRGRFLVRPRPEGGLWAGMWEGPTVESSKRPGRPALEAMGLAPSRRSATFEFATTHRMLRFDVWEATLPGAPPKETAWKTRAQLARLPISSPQRRILLGGADATVMTREDEVAWPQT